jgi:gliding motility-associated-like protein
MCAVQIKHLIISFLLVLINALGHAQTNLVNNPSFETYSTCPSTWSQIGFCTGWGQPTNHYGSPDYDNSCCTTTTSGVPVNAYGSQAAYSGDAYVGLIMKGGGSLAQYREYVQGTLSSALVAGSPYVVSARIAHAQNSQNSSDDFGIHFGTTAPQLSSSGGGTLGVTPQVANASGNFLSTNGWVLFQDTFVAAGGEQYITIGSFASTPNSQSTGTSTGWAHVYVYVDDVHVYLLQSLYGDTLLCLGDTTTLYSSLDTNVSWVESSNPTNVLSTSDTFQVWPTITTTYWAYAGVDTHSINVHVIEVPTNFAGSNVTVCEHETVTRFVEFPGYQQLWSNNQTDSLFTTVDSGYHWLEIDTLGCTSRDSFHVAFYDFPEYNLGNDTAICFYDVLQLTTGLSNIYQFNWNTGSNQPSLVANNTGTYWVDVTNAFCTFRDSIVITYRPPVTVELGNDSHLCYQNVVPMYSTTANATSFDWSTGATTPDLQVDASGTYTLIVGDGFCEAKDSAHYYLHFLPQVDLGNDTNFCRGENVLLDAAQPAGVNVLWNTSQATNQITVNQVGLCWANVSDQYCSIRDSIIIGQYPILDVDLGEDIKTCEGKLTTLTPTSSEPVSNFEWDNGITDSEITVSKSGTYAVTINNGTCSASDEINVYYYKYPVIDLGNDTSVCPKAKLIFDVTQPALIAEYSWFDGSQAPARLVNTEDKSWYWVGVTNVVCSTTDSIYIEYRNTPNAFLGNDTSICEGEDFVLKPIDTIATQYEWSTNESESFITIREEGEYFVTLSDGKCATVDSIQINHKPQPTELKLDGPEEICLGEKVMISAFDPLYKYYKWQDGSDLSEFEADSAGKYWVAATHICGIDRDTINIERCECSVYVPNAFTPGTNSINDLFKISIDCRVVSMTLRIYNRWGEILFESKDQTDFWDGTYKGSPVSLGGYGWDLTLEAIQEGRLIKEKRSGTVSLIR